MINFDKIATNKGALPVIMKKENQKIINNKQDKNEKKDRELINNQINNNDISGVNMSDEALKNFKNMKDDSSFLDVSKIRKWIK